MLKIATWDDYQNIIAMISRFASDSPYHDVYVDTGKLTNTVRGILEGDRAKSIILLYIVDDRIVGMLAATTSELVINYDKIAHELMWWVEPEYRGGRAGIELLKAFEFWAKKIGCTKIQMSLVETEDAPKVQRIYTKFGYTPVERAFLKDI